MILPRFLFKNLYRLISRCDQIIFGIISAIKVIFSSIYGLQLLIYIFFQCCFLTISNPWIEFLDQFAHSCPELVYRCCQILPEIHSNYKSSPLPSFVSSHMIFCNLVLSSIWVISGDTFFPLSSSRSN